MNRYLDLAFTPTVRAAQSQYDSRRTADRMLHLARNATTLTDRETSFIAERDSFYLGSVSESGWPYVQFRGGPKGFVKALDENTLGYADFGGNRQYISTGNIQADDRVSLFFMDYAHRRRLKMFARARITRAADTPELARVLRDETYDARVERAVLFTVEAFDWNCPQHITPRFTAEEWRARTASAEGLPTFALET